MTEGLWFRVYGFSVLWFRVLWFRALDQHSDLMIGPPDMQQTQAAKKHTECPMPPTPCSLDELFLTYFKKHGF